MITNEMIKTYKDLVENNCYSELLVQVAKDLKLFHYEKMFESILTIHDIEGYMNNDVYTVRKRIVDDMLTYLKIKLSENDYNLIKQYV